jgi:hypothetical protein
MDECLLQIAGTAVGLADTFDGDHAASVCLGSQDQARIHQPAVQQHRAGAAFSNAATYFGTGQTQKIPQQCQKRGIGGGFNLSPLAVKRKVDLHTASPILKTCPSTRSVMAVRAGILNSEDQRYPESRIISSTVFWAAAANNSAEGF